MPFSPLPDFLLEKLRVLAEGQDALVLDLGCGDGALGQVMSDQGVKVIGLDSLSPRLGTAARVVGDALKAPLLPDRADLVVAGNLFRHLLIRDPDGSFLKDWGGLLKPRGWLVLLEDERACQPPSVLNYCSLQDFLITVTEGRRGKLLALADFLKIAARVALPGPWRSGLKPNCWPADPRAVTRLLRGQGASCEGEAARLIEAIELHGLEYGDYWWACWERL